MWSSVLSYSYNVKVFLFWSLSTAKKFISPSVGTLSIDNQGGFEDRICLVLSIYKSQRQVACVVKKITSVIDDARSIIDIVL